MKKMVLLLLTFSLLLLLSPVAGADKLQPKTQAGDKALLFTINGLGDFGVGGAPAGMLVWDSEDGVEMTHYQGLGFKTFLSDGIALRVGLCYASQGLTTETDDGDQERNSSVLSIQPAIEYHLYQAEAVSIYTGGGLYFAKSTMTHKAPDTEDQTYSMSSLGFAGLIGAEFYPWKSVSLAAEYQIGYASGSSTYDDGTDKVDGPKAHMMGINTLGVTLGIHF
ncbi:MAG TPA: outer membrane beta-barrel protein [bacterium]|nr:outer membrane beta-barrel protein [bacterium]HQG45774.1 outer membrane beta-barrel protein [bacterium]HQI49486.1 outer membrane beta-barrel protein [bacterium]HQJ64838.1 outer membrane beta-barrel protein [bacterium]